jgi:CheY-like chemotaxis protein
MTRLAGLRVFVVEDESLVALMVEEMLRDLGCEVAACAGRLADACRLAATTEFDVALLDVNLGGTLVFPVAEILRERQIPFFFSTGYGITGLPREFSGHPVLTKPYSTEQLRQMFAQVLGR